MTGNFDEQRPFWGVIFPQDDDLSLYAPLIVTLLGTGCRIGEIAGLQWSDIDFKKSEIHITRQLQYNKTPANDARTALPDSGRRILGFYIS